MLGPIPKTFSRLSTAIPPSPTYAEVVTKDLYIVITYCSLLFVFVMLNKLRCHAHFKFSANQITRSRLFIKFTCLMVNSADPDQFRSQLIWICTVCKSSTYSGLVGLGLTARHRNDFKIHGFCKRTAGALIRQHGYKTGKGVRSVYMYALVSGTDQNFIVHHQFCKTC